jgi:ATP-dependent RNA helicase DDX24/MAK5
VFWNRDVETSADFLGSRPEEAEKKQNRDAGKEKEHDGMQIFVFSATMSKDLQRNLKQRRRPRKPTKHKDSRPRSTLGTLSRMYVQPFLINNAWSQMIYCSALISEILSRKSSISALKVAPYPHSNKAKSSACLRTRSFTLILGCIMVTDQISKDVYLYYFLLRYPGRSLVFLSAIDGIRRLMPLLDLLNVKAFPLHSQLEQRQRLKNLDR